MKCIPACRKDTTGNVKHEFHVFETSNVLCVCACLRARALVLDKYKNFVLIPSFSHRKTVANQAVVCLRSIFVPLFSVRNRR